MLEYSYRINNSHKRLCFLIDQNESLRYNVASLKSPGALTRKLAYNNIKLDTPVNWHNIRLARAESKIEEKKPTYESSFKIAAKALASIFMPKTEAIAQDLNKP